MLLARLRLQDVVVARRLVTVAASSALRTITGRRKIIRLVLCARGSCSGTDCPARDVAQERHVVLPAACTWSSIRPPSTTIWPSSTSTVESSERLLVLAGGCRATCLHARNFLEDLAAHRARPRMIWGFTFSVRPTSLRSMVWNGVAVVRRCRCGEGAGNEGHVLAHGDLRLLVVQRHQVGRGQDVGAGVALQRVRQHAEVST